jgi:carbonic anhydrase
MSLKKKGSATALVLSCIDPRYISLTTELLNKEKDLHKDYDLFILAGSELGVLEKPHWEDVFHDHIDIAIKLHKITKIICVSHEDCGFYKQVYQMKHDTDLGLHQKNQLKLRDHLKTEYPSLSYDSYILTDKGEFLKTT